MQPQARRLARKPSTSERLPKPRENAERQKNTASSCSSNHDLTPQEQRRRDREARRIARLEKRRQQQETAKKMRELRRQGRQQAQQAKAKTAGPHSKIMPVSSQGARRSAPVTGPRAPQVGGPRPVPRRQPQPRPRISKPAMYTEANVGNQQCVRIAINMALGYRAFSPQDFAKENLLVQGAGGYALSYDLLRSLLRKHHVSDFIALPPVIFKASRLHPKSWCHPEKLLLEFRQHSLLANLRWIMCNRGHAWAVRMEQVQNPGLVRSKQGAHEECKEGATIQESAFRLDNNRIRPLKATGPFGLYQIKDITGNDTIFGFPVVDLRDHRAWECCLRIIELHLNDVVPYDFESHQARLKDLRVNIVNGDSMEAWLEVFLEDLAPWVMLLLVLIEGRMATEKEASLRPAFKEAYDALQRLQAKPSAMTPQAIFQITHQLLCALENIRATKFKCSQDTP